jgi:hypothetical protein
MTDREALAALTAALDAYFAAKGSEDVQPFNALMKALSEAKEQMRVARR